MSLYTRNQKIAFGRRAQSRVHKGEGLTLLVKGNPLSPFYVSPVTEPNTKAVYNYLVSVQMRQYKKTLELSSRITMAHIKLALKKHSPEYVCRSIRWAAMISRYPYSVPFAIKAFEVVGEQFDLRPRGIEKADNSPTVIGALF